MSDYLTNFIITASRTEFEAGGRQWRLRQPTPEEAADGDSAYRLARRRVLDDVRLAEVAGSREALEREANIRASAAEAVYMLPLLLEKPDGEPAFNPHDPASLARFEALEPAVIQQMVKVYWEVIQKAVTEAKKKAAPTG